MILIIQRVLTPYRLNLFLELNNYLNLKVFYGEKLENENLKTSNLEDKNFKKIKNLYIGFSNRYLIFQLIPFITIFKYKPKFIVIEANPRIISIFLIKIFGILFKTKIYGWGLGYLKNHNIFERIYLKIFYKNFDKIIAYSTKAKKDYLKYFQKKQITIIQNSLIINKLKIKPLKSKSTNIKIIFIGRIIKSKKLEKFIYLLKNLNNYELNIIGDGDRGYIDQLYKKYTFNRLNFSFHGHKTGRELALFLSNSDLMVLPGNGGLAINQALMYKLPVISVFADGTEKDLITNNFNGFVSENYFQMRLNIKKFLYYNNKNRLKNNSFKIFKHKISKQIYINNWLLLFNEK